MPEATIMMIESAERFGLSQLHQLRGRVGRGPRPAWCICMCGRDLGRNARRRLRTFAATTDGFVLAQADLDSRGVGELAGTHQWGPSGFRFADPVRHHKMVAAARDTARRICERGESEHIRSLLSRYHRTELEIRTG